MDYNIPTLREIFPNFPEGLLHVREVNFITKLKFMNCIAGDLKKYKQEFPHLSDKTISNLYLELLDRIDRENTKIIKPVLLPFKLLMDVFKYIDFIDLARYSFTNTELYDHINKYPYFKDRFKWEREHYQYISDKLEHNLYEDLPFKCMNVVEQSYKNHVILKRNLYRVIPKVSPGKKFNKYCKFSGLQVYQMHYQKKHKTKISSSDMYRKASIEYKELNYKERAKYDYSATNARKHGFIYCFRNIPWNYTHIKDHISVNSDNSEEFLALKENEKEEDDTTTFYLHSVKMTNSEGTLDVPLHN